MTGTRSTTHSASKGCTLGRVEIPTATGSVAADELGVTLPHEHLFVLSPEFQRNYPWLWDADAGIRSAVEQLEHAYDVGVRTMVDMTVLGQGRDVQLVERVARATRVNLVLATGVYTLDGIPPFARFRGPGTPFGGEEPLVDLLLRDITEGIGGTSVRAALVKFACESTPPDASAHRMAAVVAEVYHRTGVPVVVHSDPFGGNGIVLVDLLVAEGVPPARVVIAHAGDSPDLHYLRALADTGCLIGYDRYGMVTFAPDEQRNETLVALVRAGHTRQILASQDNATHIDYLTGAQRAAAYPEWSYTHLVERVLPQLYTYPGIDQSTVDIILTENPRRLLAPGPVVAEHVR